MSDNSQSNMQALAATPAPSYSEKPSHPETLDASLEDVSLAEPSPSGSIQSSSSEQRPWQPSRRLYGSFSIICAVVLLSAFESSVVGNVLPTVASDLRLGSAYIWCSIAFLLSGAIIQPFYAQLQDALGRKPPLLGGITLFAAGSICCGAARGTATLIAGRVLQGLGSSGIDIISETLLGDLIPLRYRPKWFGTKQAVYAAGCVLGPFLGGVFSEKISWRWVFWLNVPLCLVLGLAIAFGLKLQRPHGSGLRERLTRSLDMDWAGIGLLSLTLLFGTISLSDAHPLGNVVSCVLFGIACVALLAFIAYQTWAMKCSPRKDRLFVSPNFFQHPRTSLIGLLNITLWGAMAYGTQLILPIHLQAVKEEQAMASGIKMLPITALLVVFSFLSGHALEYLGNRKGCYKWLQMAGFALATIGTGFMIALDADSSDGLLYGSMVVCAIGSGSAIPTILPSVMVELRDSDNGVATGNWAFLRSVGAIVGALLPAINFNYQAERNINTIQDVAIRDRIRMNGIWNEASADFMEKLPFQDQATIKQMFMTGLRNTFIIFTVAGGIAFAATFAMKSVELRQTNDTKFGLEESIPDEEKQCSEEK